MPPSRSPILGFGESSRCFFGTMHYCTRNDKILLLPPLDIVKDINNKDWDFAHVVTQSEHSWGATVQYHIPTTKTRRMKTLYAFYLIYYNNTMSIGDCPRYLRAKAWWDSSCFELGFGHPAKNHSIFSAGLQPRYRGIAANASPRHLSTSMIPI